MEPGRRPSLNLSRMLPTLALLAGSSRPIESPPQPHRTDRRPYDPRVALQHRIERMVRKAANYRRQHKLPPVTEDEIRKWVTEEAAKLGLQLKEVDDGDDGSSASDDQS